ncbi:MAG: hypothetical protein Crog3KO_18350 [Crocinitomicaceae bacterium]
MSANLDKLSGEQLKDEKIRQEIRDLVKRNKEKKKWYTSPIFLLTIIPIITTLITWFVNKDYIDLQIDKRKMEQEIAQLHIEKKEWEIKKKEDLLSAKESNLIRKSEFLVQDSLDILEKEKQLSTQRIIYDSLISDANNSIQSLKEREVQMVKKFDEFTIEQERNERLILVYDYLINMNELQSKIHYAKLKVNSHTYSFGSDLVLPFFEDLLNLCEPQPDGMILTPNWNEHCLEITLKLEELIATWKERNYLGQDYVFETFHFIKKKFYILRDEIIEERSKGWD